MGDVVGYALCDRIEDPITIDIEEDEGHIYVTAIERSQLISQGL